MFQIWADLHSHRYLAACERLLTARDDYAWLSERASTAAADLLDPDDRKRIEAADGKEATDKDAAIVTVSAEASAERAKDSARTLSLYLAQQQQTVAHFPSLIAGHCMRRLVTAQLPMQEYADALCAIALLGPKTHAEVSYCNSLFVKLCGLICSCWQRC